MHKVKGIAAGSHPLVSVLMSVCNGADYLAEAIKSILIQTFSDFELLIIDDCSTDGSIAVIQGFHDPRIRLVHNGTNLGVSESLNKGLELTRGKYVARMDHDDVCMPERLSRQVAFMETHNEIGICGTWVEAFGKTDGQICRYPTDPDTIKCTHIFAPALAHPSVMIRKEMLKNFGLFYDTSFKRAQDYDFWVRVSKYSSLANIGEVLLRYRLHHQQVSQLHNEEQLEFAGKVRLTQLHNLGIIPTAEEFKIHQSISLWRFEADRLFVDKVETWFSKLIDENMRAKTYPEKAFPEIICGRWFEVCDSLTELGPWMLKKFILSPLSRKVKAPWRRYIAFFMNCLLGRRRCKSENVTNVLNEKSGL